MAKDDGNFRSFRDDLRKLISNEDLGEPYLAAQKFVETCSENSTPVPDAIAISFKSDDFNNIYTWDFVFYLLSLNKDKIYCASIFIYFLRSENLYELLKKNSKICFYYANILLWKYADLALSKKDVEGVNFRIDVINSFFEFGMVEICPGIVEDLVRSVDAIEDDAYADVLIILDNNRRTIEDIIERSSGKMKEDLLELISLL